jgi:acyl-CoA thioesterase-1
MFAVQASQKVKYNFAGTAIEISGRFIGQQELRLGDQSARQGQPLLLAAGKLAGTVMAALLQSDMTQPRGSFLFGILPRIPASQKRHGNVLQRRKFRQQVVELPHIADFAVTELGGCIFRKRVHLGICAVYGTAGRTIKSPEDVQ